MIPALHYKAGTDTRYCMGCKTMMSSLLSRSHAFAAAQPCAALVLHSKYSLVPCSCCTPAPLLFMHIWQPPGSCCSPPSYLFCIALLPMSGVAVSKLLSTAADLLASSQPCLLLLPFLQLLHPLFLVLSPPLLLLLVVVVVLLAPRPLLLLRLLRLLLQHHCCACGHCC